MAAQFPEGISTRKDLKEWLIEHMGEKYEVLESKSSDFGKTLWMALKPFRMNPRVSGSQISIACFRMEKGEDSWGYVEYDEAVNPYYDCPDSIIELAGESSNKGTSAWREKVRAS